MTIKSPKILIFIITVLVLGTAMRLYFAYHVPSRPDEDAYLGPARVMREYAKAGEFEKILDLDITPEHPQLVKLMFALTLDDDELQDIPTEIVPGRTTPMPPNSQRNARLQVVATSFLTILTLALTNPIAALLLAVDPIHFQFGSVAYIDAMPTLFTALMAYFYLKAQSTGTDRIYPVPTEGNHIQQFLRQPKYRYLALSGICLGVAVACKYPYAWIGVILVLHALVYRLVSLKQLIAWGILSIIIFFAFNPYIWKNPIERVYEQLTFHEEYADVQLEKDNHALRKPIDQLTQPSYYLPSKVKHPLWNPLGRVVFALAIPGTIVLLRQKSFYGWWLVLGLVFLMVWPTQWIQHNMMIVVPYSFAAATGVPWIGQQIQKLSSLYRKNTVTP